MERFESERLLFRPWEPGDDEALFAIASNPGIGPNCGWQPHGSIGDSRTFLADTLIGKPFWAIVRKEDGALMGNISLEGPDLSSEARDASEAEIGFWIGPDYEGRGYITEACLRMLEHAFDELGLETVWIGHHDENLGSARVQAKCGFKLHHRIPDHYSKGKGRITPKTVNWMRAEDWRAMRGGRS